MPSLQHSLLYVLLPGKIYRETRILIYLNSIVFLSFAVKNTAFLR